MEKISIVFFILIFPLISIWSVNVLFLTGIPYSFTTWIASMWLTFLILSKSNREKQV